MNYSETIRNYISEHQNELFDVGYEYTHNFGMMEKKTFIRIILRLEEEWRLYQIAKGVYYIKGNKDFSDAKIINCYCEDESGMIVGDKLFENLGLKETSDKVIILTNKIERNKTIGKYSLRKVNQNLFFFEQTKDIIALLEIYEKLKEPYDLMNFVSIITEFVKNYNNLAFEIAISNLKYSASTIMKLKSVLEEFNIKHNTLEIYKRNYKSD